MDFIEITVADIDGEAAEAVSELFNRYGYGGAVVETYPPHFDRATVRTVIHIEDNQRLHEIEALLSLIGQALPTGLPLTRLQEIGKSDWATSWREHFHPIRVAKHFVIKPSWRDYQPAAEDIIIEIDPGMAFGSGLHPTTQLCLKILEVLPLQGKSFFDVGVGSAILSLAALNLGAGPVRAVDIDEVAVQVARENFERNGFPVSEPSSSAKQSQIEIAVGSAGDRGEQQWQIVVANILAHILIEIMVDLSQAVAPDGVLILSGIIVEQEEEMLAAFAAHNLRVVDRHKAEDWVAFVTKRKD